MSFDIGRLGLEQTFTVITMALQSSEEGREGEREKRWRERERERERERRERLVTSEDKICAF